MARNLTTSVLQINIMRMCKIGMIPKNGYFSGRLLWHQDDEEIGSILFKATTGQFYSGITFSYRTTSQGGKRRNIKQKVSLTGVDCYLGGYRLYFKCSGCARRVAILYSTENGFFCRNCCDLAYESQNQSKSMRRCPYKLFDYMGKEEELSQRIKQTHYAQKPTKKYKQLKELQMKCEIGAQNYSLTAYNKGNNEQL